MVWESFRCLLGRYCIILYHFLFIFCSTWISERIQNPQLHPDTLYLWQTSWPYCPVESTVQNKKILSVNEHPHTDHHQIRVLIRHWWRPSVPRFSVRPFHAAVQRPLASGSSFPWHASRRKMFLTCPPFVCGPCSEPWLDYFIVPLPSKRPSAICVGEVEQGLASNKSRAYARRVWPEISSRAERRAARSICQLIAGRAAQLRREWAEMWIRREKRWLKDLLFFFFSRLQRKPSILFYFFSQHDRGGVNGGCLTSH